jgi:RNA polymerase sigma-70 factor (ECF subfamily)
MNNDDELDDGTWISRVRQGDERAARALFQRLYPTVIKSVRAHLPRRSSEGDLAQAAFLKIFKNLGQFSGRVPLEHWVSRIAVNTCLTELRRECGRPELRMSDLSEGEEGALHNLMATTEELMPDQTQDARDLVRALLSKLKPEERLIITLLHIEERSTKEIAQLTGWSISRVKVKAFRARGKMRKIWQQLLDAGPQSSDERTRNGVCHQETFGNAVAAVAYQTANVLAG